VYVCYDAKDGSTDDVEYYVKSSTSSDSRRPQLIPQEEYVEYRKYYDDKQAEGQEELGVGMRKVSGSPTKWYGNRTRFDVLLT